MTGDSVDDGFDSTLSSFVLGGTFTVDAWKADVNLYLTGMEEASSIDFELLGGYQIYGGDGFKLYLSGGYMNMSVEYSGNRETTTALLYGLDFNYSLAENISLQGGYSLGTSGKLYYEIGNNDESSGISTYQFQLNYLLSDTTTIFLNYRSDYYKEPYQIKWSTLGAGVLMQF